MEQLEPIETLNTRLMEIYGRAWNNDPIYRIVWSEDQYEKRLTDCTDSGVRLLYPEIRELPKYKQWIHNKYILEKLQEVPAINIGEVITKTSYEPLHVFEDGFGNPLPPKWEACQFVINLLNAALGKETMFAKYIDPENTPEMAQEFREKKLQEIEDSLFGNESNVGDALAHGQAVIVPRNFEKAN